MYTELECKSTMQSIYQLMPSCFEQMQTLSSDKMRKFEKRKEFFNTKFIASSNEENE